MIAKSGRKTFAKYQNHVGIYQSISGFLLVLGYYTLFGTTKEGLYQREMASLLQRLNRQQNAYMKAKENMPSHCEGVHGGQHGVGTEKVGKRRRLVPAPLGCTQVRETLTDYSEKKYPRHAKCVKQTAYDTRPPPPQGKGAREAPGRDLDSGSGDPPLLARLRDARQRWAEAKRAAEVAGVRAKGLSGQTAWGPEAPDEAREEEEEGEGGEEVAREDMVAWLVRRVTSTRTSAGRGAEGTEARQEEQPPRPCESGLRRMEGHPGEQQDSTRVKSALQRLKLRAREVLREQADLDRHRGPQGAGTSRYTSNTAQPSSKEASIEQPSCDGWEEEEVGWEEETW